MFYLAYIYFSFIQILFKIYLRFIYALFTLYLRYIYYLFTIYLRLMEGYLVCFLIFLRYKTKKS